MEPTIYNPSIYKGAGIYKTGDNGGGGGGGVPSDAFIDLSNTGLKKNNNVVPFLLPFAIQNNCKIIVKCKTNSDINYNGNTTLTALTTSSTSSWIASSNDWFLRYVAVNGYSIYQNGGGFGSNFYYGFNLVSDDVELIYTENECFFNGESFGQTTPVSKSFNYIHPFGSNQQTGLIVKQIIIKDASENQLLNFLAAKRKFDNALGLYECNTGSFYTSVQILEP